MFEKMGKKFLLDLLEVATKEIEESGGRRGNTAAPRLGADWDVLERNG